MTPKKTTLLSLPAKKSSKFTKTTNWTLISIKTKTKKKKIPETIPNPTSKSFMAITKAKNANNPNLKNKSLNPTVKPSKLKNFAPTMPSSTLKEPNSHSWGKSSTAPEKYIKLPAKLINPMECSMTNFALFSPFYHKI